MKKTLKYVLVLFINLIIYFLLQLIGSILFVFIYGSGCDSDKYIKPFSFLFVGIHLLTLIFLYFRKKIIDDLFLLILNVILIVSLYLYCVIYLASISTANIYP
jgi:hypothetical protein